MKRILALCSLALCAVVLVAQGPAGGRFGPMGRGLTGWTGQISRTPVTGLPFSGVETVQSQQVLANGNQISRSQQLNVYRDSQGRTRTEQTITPPAASGRQPFTQITIVDPVAGYFYMLNSSTMTAIQVPLPKPGRSTANSGTTTPQRGRNGAEVRTSDLGTQMVNGVTTAGTQTTETIPAGKFGNAQAIEIVRTTAISTALQVPVSIRTSDPRFGTTDRELTNIVQSEPDPSLFVVPSSYTVKTGGPGGPMGRGRMRPTQ